MRVGNKAKATKTKHAKNFPNTISQSVKGLVVKNSIVPVCVSSASVRIVRAGIRNIKIMGARSKSGSSVAKFWFKRLVSGKIHNKSPVKIKNTAMTMYPINEEKKVLISFLKIDNINNG